MNSPYSLFGILVLILDIVAIISVLGGRSSIERKALWTVLILILPVVGMILYYLVGKTGQDKMTISWVFRERRGPLASRSNRHSVLPLAVKYEQNISAESISGPRGSFCSGVVFAFGTDRSLETLQPENSLELNFCNNICADFSCHLDFVPGRKVGSHFHRVLRWLGFKYSDNGFFGSPERRVSRNRTLDGISDILERHACHARRGPVDRALWGDRPPFQNSHAFHGPDWDDGHINFPPGPSGASSSNQNSKRRIENHADSETYAVHCCRLDQCKDFSKEFWQCWPLGPHLCGFTF